MPWAKVDDQWFAHRKVVGLSLEARGLWTTVLSWSCAQRSPVVPEHIVGFLAGAQDTRGAVDALVRAGLWHAPGHNCESCDPVVGGWVQHDWAEFQEKSVSEKRSEAGRKGGKASGESRRKQSDVASEPPREPNDEAPPKQTKQTDEANDEAGTQPGPALPDLQDTSPDGADDAADAAPTDIEDEFEDFWHRYPRNAVNGKLGGGASHKKSLAKWKRLKARQRAAALAAVDNYAADCKRTGTYPAHVTTWLNEERWNEWQDPGESNVRQLKPRETGYVRPHVATDEEIDAMPELR